MTPRRDQTDSIDRAIAHAITITPAGYNQP
jgi:hypothetical protein